MRSSFYSQRWFLNATKSWFVLCALCGACAAAYSNHVAQAGVRIVSLPQTSDYFFASYAYVAASYLKLGVTGDYHVIDREHMYRWECDRGRWRQLSNGVIEFTTTRTDTPLTAGPLYLYHGALHMPELVTRTRDRLARELERSRAGTFSARRLRRAAGVVHPQGFDRDLLDIDADVRQINRADLAAFTNLLTAWLHAPPVHRFFWTPYHYRGVVFLAGTGGTFAPQWSVRDCVKQIDTYHPDQHPPFLVAQISRAVWEREAEQLMPFLAYPGMNFMMALPPWLRTLVTLYVYVPLAAAPLVLLYALICIRTRQTCPACSSVARWHVNCFGNLLCCRLCKQWFAVHRARPWQARVSFLLYLTQLTVWSFVTFILFAHWGVMAFVLIMTMLYVCETIRKRFCLRRVFASLDIHALLTPAQPRWWQRIS